MVVQFGMSSSLKKTKNGGLIFYFGKEKVSIDHYVKQGDVFVYNSIIPLIFIGLSFEDSTFFNSCRTPFSKFAD